MDCVWTGPGWESVGIHILFKPVNAIESAPLTGRVDLDADLTSANSRTKRRSDLVAVCHGLLHDPPV
jgi:hypothetical protein